MATEGPQKVHRRSTEGPQNVLYQSVEIEAGIRIGDVGQPNILVSLVIAALSQLIYREV